MWLTSKALLLLQPDVIEASMSIQFMKEQHVKHGGNLCCGRHCDFKSISEKKIVASDEIQKIGGSPVRQVVSLSSVDSQSGPGSSCAKYPESNSTSQDSQQPHLSCILSSDNRSHVAAFLSDTVPPSAAAEIPSNSEPTHAAADS